MKRYDPIEIRCGRGACPCGRDKLIATIHGLPDELRGRGVEVEVACPTHKSGRVRVPI